MTPTRSVTTPASKKNANRNLLLAEHWSDEDDENLPNRLNNMGVSDEPVKQNLDSQIKVWQKQLDAHQRAINRIGKFVETGQLDKMSLEMVRIRKEKLGKEWIEVQDIYYKLIGQIGPEQVEEWDELIENLEEIYYEAHSAMSAKIVKLENEALPRHPLSDLGPEDRPIKLIMPLQPHNMQNTWGKFDGGLRKWMGFRDRFKAAIHDNADVTNAYKLSYLLQSLTGAAAQALGKSDNYDEAWKRLLELYDKPYLIAQEHLRDFYKLPTLQPPASAAQLEKMSNVTHEVIRQLQALEYPVEHWDFVFVHGLHDRLDTKTARDWALANQSNNPPVSDMLKFLDREAAALQHMRSDREVLAITIANNPRPTRSAGAAQKEIGKKTGTTAKQYRCEACTDYHQLYECPTFAALNWSARKDFMERKHICENCLKKGHQKDNCYDERRCNYRQCQDDPKHNSLLCPHKVNKSLSVNVAKTGSGI